MQLHFEEVWRIGIPNFALLFFFTNGTGNITYYVTKCDICTGKQHNEKARFVQTFYITE